MATLGSSFLDIIDVMKRSGSDDKIQIATIIEMLKEENAMLDDAMTMECNLGTRHRTTLRTKLPTGSWGKLYQGTPATKSGTAQIEDTTGFFEVLSSIDTRLLKLSDGNEGALRLSEATAAMETISQGIASQLIYGNEDLNPERFTGFAPRFNSLTTETGGQIVDAGGTGSDNTSVWFVTWADNACHMLYPGGTQAGIDRDDKGQQRVLDGSSNAYYVMEELFTQHAGLSVRDYRQVARVANIDVSNLAAGSVDIYAFMRQGFWKLKKHRIPGGRIAVYCNSDVLEALDADSTPTTNTGASTDSPVRLRPTEVDGFEVMSYRGFPVRQVDAILNTEAQIT